MGGLRSAYNEIRSGGIKWEDPLVQFQKISGNEFERALLSRVINTIAKGSEFGKTILENAAKNGYTLCMDHLFNAAGLCDCDKKMLILNPAFPEDRLVSTLVHEARHAEQDGNATWKEDRGKLTFKSDIMLSRAQEADAQAAATAVCFEIRANTGNAGPLSEMSGNYPFIVGYLAQEAKDKNAPVTDKMMQGAFKAWYMDTGMMETYEQCYQVSHMKNVTRKAGFKETAFDTQLTSAQIVSALCVKKDGSSYFEDDKDVLADRDRCSITAETMKVCEKFFKSRKEKTGKSADESYKTLKVRYGERSFKNKIDGLKRAFSSEYRETSRRDKNDEIGFKKEGSSSDIRRINHLINDLCEDPEKRKTLTALKTAGYAIGFENAMRLDTVRDDYKKVVLLNPALKDDKLKDALLSQGEKVAARTVVQTKMAVLSAGRS